MNKIYNYNTLIKYLKQYDQENFDRYISLIKFYQKNSIHNIYLLCDYIFSQIENRSITNKYNYFCMSLKNNIKKLDKNFLSSDSDISTNEKWINKNIKSTIATQEEQEELRKLLWQETKLESKQEN